MRNNFFLEMEQNKMENALNTLEELKEFNKALRKERELGDDQNNGEIFLLDKKNFLKAEQILNKESKSINFAFLEKKKVWDKLSAIEKENVFRKIDNLPPLQEPEKKKKLSPKASRSFIVLA